MGGTVVVLHYTFREEEVAEEGSDEQVGAVEASEELPRKCSPRNGVRNSGEDPVQFAQWGTAVLEVSRNLHDHIRSDVVWQLMIHDEEPESNIDGGCETGSENIGWELRR